MNSKRLLSVREMEPGETGTVVQILGGHGLVRRLESLGIRPGKRLTKVSSMFLRGPVTVQIDSTQLAIGFGMANKIMVELENRR